MQQFKDVCWNVVADGILSPEGPAVDGDGNIYLVSRWTGRVVKVGASGGVSEVIQTGGKPQSVAVLASGDLLLADAKNHALQRISLAGALGSVADQVNVANQVNGEPFLGPNDLVVADDRVVYMTDPGLDMDAHGRILRIDIESGQTSVLAADLRFPNGITISDDGRYLIASESLAHRVLRFKLLAGGTRLGAAEVFCQFADHHPDGIAFDVEGNLLVTICGGGSLEVVSPRGTVIASIPTGGKNCTNCVFGGQDFQTLYLTEDDQQALLSTRWPVPGERRYSRSLSN